MMAKQGIAELAPAAQRYAAVDAMRGLIMIVMAIDHASGFIARQHGAEFWYGALSIYDGAFPFLTRWITHLCAPGFAFLMGAGIYWYSAGKNQNDAMWRTVKRGLALILLAQLLEGPMVFIQARLAPPAVRLSKIIAAPPNDGTVVYWSLVTITMLGAVMVICGLLLRAKPAVWLGVCALSVFATNTLLPADGKLETWWMALFLAAGIADHIAVIYPIIPWLGVATAGMYFGYWWRKDPAKAQRNVWAVGLALLLVAVGLRAMGGWGNIRPPRDGGWIEFLNNVKYPPSLVYWTMSVGIDLILVWILMKVPAALRAAKSPLIVFGQTPLFFYFTHFYLLLAFAFLWFRKAASLEMAYVMWAVALVLLYPVCAWYRDFKLTKPRESLWRMF